MQLYTMVDDPRLDLNLQERTTLSKSDRETWRSDISHTTVSQVRGLLSFCTVRRTVSPTLYRSHGLPTASRSM